MTGCRWSKLRMSARFGVAVAAAITTSSLALGQTPGPVKPMASVYESLPPEYREKLARTLKTLPYHGLYHVVPEFAATGETYDIEMEFAEQLCKRDFLPEVRKPHFAGWETPEAMGKIVGWTGEIVEMRPIPGGYRFRVKISMDYSNKSFWTNDHTIETYDFTDQRIQYVWSEAPLESLEAVWF